MLEARLTRLSKPRFIFILNHGLLRYVLFFGELAGFQVIIITPIVLGERGGT